jgi:acetyltransferase-like isoleucine patch superfamily enzyme
MKYLIKAIISYLRYYSKINGFGGIIEYTIFKGKNQIIIGKCIVKNSKIHNNIKINEKSKITNSILKGHNTIGMECQISNSTIGQFSYLSDNCKLNNASVGNFCSIGPNLLVGLGTHPLTRVSTSPLFYSTNNMLNLTLVKSNTFKEYKKTTIGHDVWIGANVIIKDGINIGNGSVIGAGSIVTKDVQKYAIIGGAPAKTIRFRHNEEIIKNLEKLNWYHKDIEYIKNNIDIFQIENLENKDLLNVKD